MARTETGLGLGRARSRVLLQQAVNVSTPAPALADERDLVPALARHHALDDVAEGGDGRIGHIAEGRSCVAEDPRIAVLIGADRVPDPEIGDDVGEDRHRMLDARVLRIRLDSLEGRLRTCALHLELRHEDRRLTADALGVDDRSLVGEEPEAGEVLDVVGAEEDVARAVLTPNVLKELFAAPRELCCRNPGERFGLPLHRVSLSTLDRHILREDRASAGRLVGNEGRSRSCSRSPGQRPSRINSPTRR